MATAKKEAQKKYKVTIKENADYCGEGAGGAQFAHGQAVVVSERMANWYREHDGYTVEEMAEV